MSTEVLFAGKYAAFVLSAYGVTILGLGGAIVLSWRSYRRAGRKLANMEKALAAQRADTAGVIED